MPRKRQRSTTTKPEAAASTSSSIKQKKTAATPKRTWLRKVEKEEEEEVFVLEGDEDDTNSVEEVGDRMGTGNADSRPGTKEKRGSGKAEKKISTPVKVKEDETPARFVGAQIPGAEARKKWPHRYANKASDGDPDYICRISEMFESVDRTLYFTTQWYYRSTDAIIKDKYISDPKCVFFSEIRNYNPLECLTWKLNIVDPENRRARSSGCDFYCDMLYLLPYSTFLKLPTV
ncbi:DNA (cytosine-5)-methyltransferase CMT3-like [Populus nigra]|uniref:DNA (cytosine-5)-methyltransferase CMT3-like n=1 Tax=Populus nigra TaxID=3691 RepID=UPI002B277E2C|nr:DNA (cytosine-5)-methyltransferase CMT3-like [Populus nigra]